MSREKDGQTDRCPVELDTATLLGLANEALTRVNNLNAIKSKPCAPAR